MELPRALGREARKLRRCDGSASTISLDSTRTWSPTPSLSSPCWVPEREAHRSPPSDSALPLLEFRERESEPHAAARDQSQCCVSDRSGSVPNPLRFDPVVPGGGAHAHPYPLLHLQPQPQPRLQPHSQSRSHSQSQSQSHSQSQSRPHSQSRPQSQSRSHSQSQSRPHSRSHANLHARETAGAQARDITALPGMGTEQW